MSTFSALPRSRVIKGFEWTGERIGYRDLAVRGDSFPVTWADDGEMYTSAGDPTWGETCDGLDVEKFSGGPTDYKITKANPMNDYRGCGGDGPKPTGMICVDGVLYLAVQNLRRARLPAHGAASQHGSDAHIISSSTHGLIWTPALAHIAEPMFPGHLFGGPAFINFGQNNANARDGYVYAVSGDQWDNGSNVRLGRVPQDRIVEGRAWEWVCAWTAEGEPAWSGELSEAIPVLSLHRWIGTPDMVYLAGLQRYLFLTWRLHKDFSPYEGTDLVVLEAPEPWGPFSLVHVEELWQGKKFTPYCPKLPLKWLASDGLSGWLLFSGSWSPEGQNVDYYYRAHVRPFRLKLL